MKLQITMLNKHTNHILEGLYTNSKLYQINKGWKQGHDESRQIIALSLHHPPPMKIPPQGEPKLGVTVSPSSWTTPSINPNSNIIKYFNKHDKT